VIGDGSHLLKIELIAEDPDDNPDHPEWSDFVFSLIDAPEGAEIVTEGDSTYFMWTPDEGDADATVTIRVSDPLSRTLTDSTQFSVTVTDPAPINTINDSTDTGTSESKSSEESGEEGEENGEEEGEENGEEGGEEGSPDAQADAPAEPAEEDTQKEAEKIEAEVEALVEDFSKTKEAPGAGKPDAQQPQTRAEEVAEIISIMDKAAALVTQCSVSQSPFQ